MSVNRWLLAGAAFVSLAAAGAVQAGETFEAVKKKGFVQCGVNNSGLPGFAQVDD